MALSPVESDRTHADNYVIRRAVSMAKRRMTVLKDRLAYMKAAPSDDEKATRWAIDHWRDSAESIAWAKSCLYMSEGTAMPLFFNVLVHMEADILAEATARLRHAAGLDASARLIESIVRQIELGRGAAVSSQKAKPDAAGNDEPGGTAADVSDPFNDLREFASAKLKGIERRIVELICEQGGACPLADLAIDPAIKWDMPCDGTFNSAKKRINEKLKKKQWQIYRHDSKAKVKHLERK